METTDIARVIWMVDDDRSFRELSSEAALDAGIKVVNVTTEELADWRGNPLPDGAMLDGAILTGGPCR